MKNKSLEWIIIGVLVTALIGSFAFYYFAMRKGTQAEENPEANKEVEKIMISYAELEASYNSAIKDIESQVEAGDVGIEILKENLTQILGEIKAEKEQIASRKFTQNADSLTYLYEQAEQMEEMLKMSKEVLVERLAELQQENVELQSSNERLLTRNEKLVEKIEQVNEWVEKEKVKNQGLKSEMIRVEARIKKLEESGDSAIELVTQLKAEKEYFAEKLEESNNIINAQTEKISELGIIVRKVNVECFFKYMEGNSEEEAKIYLTSSGVAKRYISFFQDKKPDVYFEFTINDFMFEEGNERVDFKLFNEDNVEIYSTSKAVSKGVLRFIVPNKNFQVGKAYFITLFAGPDNLLINDMYEFRISK